MSVPNRRIGIAISLVLVVSLATVGIALAASSVRLTGYIPGPNCTVGGLENRLFNDDPNVDLHIEVKNLTGGSSIVIVLADLVMDSSIPLFITSPAGTQPFDKLRYTLAWKDDSLNLLASDTLTVNCTTGHIFKDPKELVEAYTGIYLLSTAEQAPYLSVPNAAGNLPCGVFDVNGWGRKYVGLGDFPGCTTPVTVMCYNDVGEWTAGNVSDVVMQGDYEVDFTSSQHGTCALFAQ